MDKARKRAADLAHGLRTPLTVLSNDALTLRDKGEAGMAAELEHLASVMRSHVERELALARIAASAELRRSDAKVTKFARPRMLGVIQPNSGFFRLDGSAAGNSLDLLASFAHNGATRIYQQRVAAPS